VSRLLAEGDEVYLQARLLLMLVAVDEAHPLGVDAERLGIYDFLAANPLLLAREWNDPDRPGLLLAGFDDLALAYASPAQRFVTGQLQLPHDLAGLLALGLVNRTITGRIRYTATERGRVLAAQFTSMHALAYRTAASVVVRRLRRLSERKLRTELRTWLTPIAGHQEGAS
jgi:hypothetical protein